MNIFVFVDREQGTFWEEHLWEKLNKAEINIIYNVLVNWKNCSSLEQHISKSDLLNANETKHTESICMWEYEQNVMILKDMEIMLPFLYDNLVNSHHLIAK
jgi:hypothetical protein